MEIGKLSRQLSKFNQFFDAKSSYIDIYIRNGGKTEIRVLDNGLGINSKDVKLAFKRHATSKLSDIDLSILLKT